MRVTLAALCLAVASGVLGLPAEPARAIAAGAQSPRLWGVAAPGAPTDLSSVDELARRLGSPPQLVTWYSAWSARTDFPVQAARAIAARGAVPEVTWEPWDPAAGVDQPSYSLDRITAGSFDSYIRGWARQIARYGQPVVLRFAHEMNGTWYPWAEQVNGNGPGDYARAWRHVRTVFDRVGVPNVRWLWSPNVPYAGSTSLGSLYPGDAYVDQVGLDGYNFSTLQPWSWWQSFAEIFGPGLDELRALTTLPVFITETGCPEAGGDKALWIRDMWATLAAHPEVRGLTWFDFDKEADWRLESSPASVDAFRAGLAGFH